MPSIKNIKNRDTKLRKKREFKADNRKSVRNLDLKPQLDWMRNTK